jgi:hypothetical protein
VLAERKSSSKVEDTVIRLQERAQQELAEQSQVEDLEKKINSVMEAADLVSMTNSSQFSLCISFSKAVLLLYW